MRGSLLILLLSLCCVATAQTFKEGSIRLKGGQEQPGFIGELRPGSPEGVEYKPTSDDEIQIYYANDIEGYTVEKIFYTAYHNNAFRDNDWNFIELLADGELTLMRRNNMYFIRQKSNREFTHLTHHYKNALARLTRDCPLVSIRAARVSLDKVPLGEFVKSYNECIATKRPNLDGMPRPVSIGIQVGYDYTTGTFKDEAATRYLSANKQSDRSYFQGGVEINFKGYRVSKFIGFYTGALVSFDSYSGTNRSTVDKKSPEVNEYSFKLTELKIPFGFDISRPTRKNFAVHIRGGGVMPLVLNVNSSHPYQEVSNASGTTITYGDPSLITKYKPSVMWGGGAGFDYKVSGSYVRIQAGYYAGSVSVTSNKGAKVFSTTGNLKSFNLSATYIF
ncbi:MAG: outer membrane beta-barrel protein [Bacteroidota bacterium]